MNMCGPEEQEMLIRYT